MREVRASSPSLRRVPSVSPPRGTSPGQPGVQEFYEPGVVQEEDTTEQGAGTAAKVAAASLLGVALAALAYTQGWLSGG
ncbi:hypothetical protein HaLaN_32806, partial [Haematococcus lacustris]